MIIEMADNWIAVAYGLSLGAVVLCVVWGVTHWNREEPDEPDEEIRHWAEEEDRVEDEL